MGSGGSKGSCRGGGRGGGVSSSSGGRKAKSTGKNRVFQSSCLGAPSGSYDSQFDPQVVVDHHKKEYGSNFTNRKRREPETEPNQVKREPSRKFNGEPAFGYEMPLPCMSSGGGSSGRATAAVHHSPSRCLSGFSFLPGNVSFRLSRANSLGSSRAVELSNHDDNCETLEHVQNASSIPVILNDADMDRELDRRVGVGSLEPVERNVRFSRTLSVGRLRDRVLRRASLSDFTFCPFQQNGQLGNQTHTFGGDSTDTQQSATSTSTSTCTSISGSVHAAPIISHNPVFNIQEHEVETSRSREARYHNLLEHRSNFLERRRRIRSQVRALQRLGSRSENVYGHERSCILSGQHRTGRCTCCVNNRDSSPNDETRARASISRIVMLAEALFEVLDENHQ